MEAGRIARKAAIAVQSLALNLLPSSISSSVASHPSAPLSPPYKPLASSASPYTPLGTGSRHRASSFSTPPHHRNHHLPRRRNSTPPASSFIFPWTLTRRTRWLLLAFLFLAAAFITGVTKLIIYILNPDKEPKVWQHFCTSQQEFPHALADSLAPVDVFVGVFSIDSSYERRQLIRSTYATHTLPHDVHTGAQLTNVQLKFILGRPRKLHARRVALEMEAYNDIVVLDLEENMNQGKTYAYFRWAAENATVPILLSEEPPSHAYASAAAAAASNAPQGALKSVVAWKKADYIVKADDDAFIVLSELERHLRVSPRTGTYWGYLIRNWFMGGECYALSHDLVQYIATSPDVVRYTHGKEDKKVAQWMNLHPNATGLNWVSERCWIYDGPKAGTAYSHGYLFPDYVAKLKRDAAREAPEPAPPAAGPVGAGVGANSGSAATAALPAEPRRSAEWRRKHSASTVSRWKQPYVAPRSGMSIEEEIEALVEGGGRWEGSSWVRPERVVDSPFAEEAYHAGLAPILTTHAEAAASGDDALFGGGGGGGGLQHDYAAAAEDFGEAPRIWVPAHSLVYEANDPRLRPAKEGPDAPLFRADMEADPSSGLALYNVSALDVARGGSTLLETRVSSRSEPAHNQQAAPRLGRRASLERVIAGNSARDDLDHPARQRWRDAVDGGLESQSQPHLIPSRNVPLATGGRRPPAVPDASSSLHSSPSGAAGMTWQRSSYYDGPLDALGRGNLTPEQRLRARRYLFRPHGGTVVVHYLKKSEWFLETAIALLGRDVLWPEPNAGGAALLHHQRRGGVDVALGGRAREWRMGGSPVIMPGPNEKEARIL